MGNQPSAMLKDLPLAICATESTAPRHPANTQVITRDTATSSFPNHRLHSRRRSQHQRHASMGSEVSMRMTLRAGELPSVSTVHLCTRGIERIYPNIGLLTSLVSLTICCNEIKALPAGIGHLKQLKVLDVSRNRLRQLPESIGRLTQLTHLLVSRNELEQLPESIGRLSNLRQLVVSRNALRTLPQCLGNLSRLILLDIARNPLVAIPVEVSRIAGLRRITADRCGWARVVDGWVREEMRDWRPVSRDVLMLGNDAAAGVQQDAAFLHATTQRDTMADRAEEEEEEDEEGGTAAGLEPGQQPDAMIEGGVEAMFPQLTHEHENALRQARRAVRRRELVRVSRVRYQRQFSHTPNQPPSLREFAARSLVRHDCMLPPNDQLPPLVTQYLRTAKACCMCGGPWFEHSVTRVRWIARTDRALAMEERMCWRHWDTNDQRVASMFAQLPSTCMAKAHATTTTTTATIHPEDWRPVSALLVEPPALKDIVPDWNATLPIIVKPSKQRADPVVGVGRRTRSVSAIFLSRLRRSSQFFQATARGPLDTPEPLDFDDEQPMRRRETMAL